MPHPNLPDPPTEASLREAMRDPRYWQSGHPDRPGWLAAVTEGWQRLVRAEAGGGGGDGVVQVRAYTRSVDGRPQHVGAHLRSAPQGGGAQAERWRKADAATEAEKAEKPAAEPQPVVIFVGGFMDGTSGVLLDQWKDFRTDHPGISTRYFAHDQGQAIRRFIDSLPPGTPLRMIGHRWGGDTAARIAAGLGSEGRRMQRLITIDPVGRGTSDDFYSRVRRGAAEWININASGGGLLDPSNLVAAIGRPYGQGPRRFATRFVDAPVGHADVGAMLRQPLADGLTAGALAIGLGPWK